METRKIRCLRRYSTQKGGVTICIGPNFTIEASVGSDEKDAAILTSREARDIAEGLLKMADEYEAILAEEKRARDVAARDRMGVSP